MATLHHWLAVSPHPDTLLAVIPSILVLATWELVPHDYSDCAVHLAALNQDLSQWFSSKDIERKRDDISLLIKRLSAQQKSEQVKFPHIRDVLHRNLFLQ